MKYTKQQQEEVKHFLEFLDIRTGIKNLEFSNVDVITDMQEEIVSTAYDILKEE